MSREEVCNLLGKASFNTEFLSKKAGLVKQVKDKVRRLDIEIISMWKKCRVWFLMITALPFLVGCLCSELRGMEYSLLYENKFLKLY